MPVEFRVVREPSRDLLAQISAMTPENPFYTSAYVNSLRLSGVTPFALILESGNHLLSACTAFLRTGRLNTTLEITSLPSLPAKSIFWTGLVEFCRASDISILEINTFGSTETSIEALDGETSRKGRYEFQLDLAGTDLWIGLNRRNRRSIKKAMEAGLRLKLAEESQACQIHVNIANSSLNRSRKRGEAIGYEIEADDARRFIENKAGEIYQAKLDDEVLSSILILRSETGAYAQTSGTIDAGLEYGSSQFLWYETALRLQNESLTVLNMGGTDKASLGLQEFKAGFGAKRIELESAEFYLGGFARKMTGTLIERLRSRK